MSTFDRLAAFGDASAPRWRLRPAATFEPRPARGPDLLRDPVPGPLEPRTSAGAPPPQGSFRKGPGGRTMAPVASIPDDAALAAAARGEGLNGTGGIPPPAPAPAAEPAPAPAERGRGTRAGHTAHGLPADPAGLPPDAMPAPRRPRAGPAGALPVRTPAGPLHRDAPPAPAVPDAAPDLAATSDPAAAQAPFGPPDPGRDGTGPPPARADVVGTDPAPTVPLPAPQDLDEAVRAELARRGLAGPGTRIEYRTPEPPRAPAPRPEGPAELHVHIGRVQVLPPAAPPVPAPRSPAGPAGPSPLTAFLQERARARR